MIEATANCAEPAKVVSDITIGASEPRPAARASSPNETPNANAATPIGQMRRAPSR